ncbi:hypothetical protein AB7008_00770 [Bradyrhizobium sp. 521_C7_N1_3]|uniref:hypothetical protein n=1 Tax=Bradyrhizobium sp. 521_C7_N1_3 TaxID=3240368 RepID=UPI003F8BDC1A
MRKSRGGETRATSNNAAVIARLDRAIQYSEAVVIEPMGRGVLDAPVKPGHDTEN